MRRIFAAIIATAFLFSIESVAAQEWPARPVRIINSLTPGGITDLLARGIADHLSEAFKQPFFVETRAGAGGAIAVRSMLSTEADGYNLVITTLANLVLAPIMTPKIGYDPVNDLTNVAYIAGSPAVFVVSPKSRIKTLENFIAFGKKSMRPLTYSTAGVGSNGNLVVESFAQKTLIRVEHVPYKGAAQGLTDLIGGHIDFGAPSFASASGQIRGGALIPLAHTAAERLPDYPDVPTFKELGYPEMVTTTWFALSGPPKLPREIVDKINHEVARAMATPKMQELLRRDGLLSQPMSYDEFGKFIVAETIRWRPVIEHAGLIATD